MGNKIEVGLPIRPFLYTLDQLADLFGMRQEVLNRNSIYFDGVSTGVKPRDRMMARNLAPEGKRQEWRVAEEEVVRWLKHKGFRVYDASRVRV